MRKIKAWGGTHPNEPRALEVAESLRDRPVHNVKSGIVNPLARQLGRRYVHLNMNKAYPGNIFSEKYEERRAPAVREESQGFFTVIDMHNYLEHGGDTAYIGRLGVSAEILGFLKHILGIQRLVRTDSNMLCQHVPNSFALETGVKSERGNVVHLRRAFAELANTPELPTATAAEFEWYGFLDNLYTDRMRPEDMLSGLSGFDRVPEDIAAQMGHAGTPVHMLLWGEQTNMAGCWGEIVTPIAPPDDTDWPLPVAA